MQPDTLTYSQATTAEVLAAWGLQVPSLHERAKDVQDPWERWRTSGADQLTLYPATPPGDVIARIQGLSDAAAIFANQLGAKWQVNAVALLTERERLCSTHHVPQPRKSLRGGTQLLKTADGWVALNLSQLDAQQLLPALTCGHVDVVETDGELSTEIREQLVNWAATQLARDIRDQAVLLSIACGVVPPSLGTRAADLTDVPGLLQRGTSRLRALRELVVVDLSLLWAGPLVARILAELGARVIRVYDSRRTPVVPPIDRQFDALLHEHKEQHIIDFSDLDALQRVIDGADVVISSMRPATLHRLGVIRRSDQVWLNITAHGAHDEQANRIGFGDDCAAEAGLLVWDGDEPAFAADAIADPLAGLMGVTVLLGMLATQRRGHVDLGLSDVARWAVAEPGRRV